MVTTHDPVLVVSANKMATSAEWAYLGVCPKKAMSKQHTKQLRREDYKVKLADPSTFLGKECNTCSESRRVDGYVFNPRLDGFDPYKQCSRVMDGSHMGKNNREAIRVQTSSQNTDGV